MDKIISFAGSDGSTYNILASVIVAMCRFCATDSIGVAIPRRTRVDIKRDVHGNHATFMQRDDHATFIIMDSEEDYARSFADWQAFVAAQNGAGS